MDQPIPLRLDYGRSAMCRKPRLALRIAVSALATSRHSDPANGAAGLNDDQAASCAPVSELSTGSMAGGSSVVDADWSTPMECRFR